jgi:type IV secretory pathway protease TraF
MLVNSDSMRITVASHDSYGGELSVWPTPIRLSKDQYWLVSDPDRGFDSRYFGPVNREAFTHKAYPVF